MKKTTLRFNPLKFARFILILTFISITILFSSCMLKTKEEKVETRNLPTPTVTVTIAVTPTPIIVTPSVLPTATTNVTSTPTQKMKPIKMRATAYDLSVESCGKSRKHPEYGITRTGTRATARRTVAVDPNTIPLGSLLYIEFSEEESKRNGIYIAEDTGSAVKGDIIDIYFGEDEPGSNYIHKQCFKFGKQPVKVYILRKGYK